MGGGGETEDGTIYIYTVCGEQNYLLIAMDMAKVGGPLSVVKVCTSMLCVKIGYR